MENVLDNIVLIKGIEHNAWKIFIEGWDSEKAHALGLKNYVYFAMAFSFGVELLNMKLRKKRREPVELREPTFRQTPADDQAH